MVDLKPELLKEWHPSRNLGLKADDASYHHREKVWWICGAQGHEWEDTIRARLRGRSCPFCSNMAPRVPSTDGQRMSATSRTASARPSVSAAVPLAAFHDALTTSYGGTELRKNRRYERPATVMVEKLPSEIVGYAQLKNFSAGGMMLLSDFAVHPGEFVKIRFDKPLHSSVPKTVASRVAWCQDLEDQNETVFRFGIGLRLM